MRQYLLILCLAVPLVGCTSPRVPVHGRVTLGKQPVALGEVRFVPINVPAGEPARPAVAVVIVDGKYEVTTAGGLRDGEYRVEVEVRRKTGKVVMLKTGFESAPGDETELTSPASYAGEQSPLRYRATPGAAARFDIHVPQGL